MQNIPVKPVIANLHEQAATREDSPKRQIKIIVYIMLLCYNSEKGGSEVEPKKTTLYLKPSIDKKMRVDAAQRGIRFPSDYVAHIDRERERLTELVEALEGENLMLKNKVRELESELYRKS